MNMFLKSFFSLSILAALVSSQSCGTTVRVRKEIGDYTGAELSSLVRALQALKDDGTYERYANIHQDFQSSGHNSPAFFSWHRAFLHRFENELRRVDPTLTLPYWDWTLDSQAPERSMVFKSHYFGGNGVNGCVNDGPFRNWRFQGTCLNRNFRGGRTIPAFVSPEILRNLIGAANDYDNFRQSIEYNSHASVHVGIGGSMGNMLSPRDFLFYLHHTYVDKIWWSFQTKENSRYRNAYQGSQDASLNPLNLRVRDIMDIGSLCYRYAEPQNPQNREGIAPPTTTTTTRTTPTTLTTTVSSSTTTVTTRTTSSVTTTETTTSTRPTTEVTTTSTTRPTTTTGPTTEVTTTSTTRPTSQTSTTINPTTTLTTTTDVPVPTTYKTTATKTITPTPTNYDRICKEIEKSLDLSTLTKDSQYVKDFEYLDKEELIEGRNYTIADSEDEVFVPGPYDRNKSKYIRIPAPIPDDFIKMMHYPEEKCRSLELKVFDLVVQYNNATERTSFVSSAATENVIFQSSELLSPLKEPAEVGSFAITLRPSIEGFIMLTALVYLNM